MLLLMLILSTLAIIALCAAFLYCSCLFIVNCNSLLDRIFKRSLTEVTESCLSFNLYIARVLMSIINSMKCCLNPRDLQVIEFNLDTWGLDALCAWSLLLLSASKRCRSYFIKSRQMPPLESPLTQALQRLHESILSLSPLYTEMNGDPSSSPFRPTFTVDRLPAMRTIGELWVPMHVGRVKGM